VDLYLPYFRQQLITGLLSVLPFQLLFAESSRRDQLLAPPPFSGVLSASHPLCCVLVFSSLFIQFFCEGGVVSLPRGYAGLSQGWLGKYCIMPDAHLFSLLNVSQAVLELVSGGGGGSPPIFSV
jgi:hypothetical protein